MVRRADQNCVDSTAYVAFGMSSMTVLGSRGGIPVVPASLRLVGTETVEYRGVGGLVALKRTMSL